MSTVIKKTNHPKLFAHVSRRGVGEYFMSFGDDQGQRVTPDVIETYIKNGIFLEEMKAEDFTDEEE